MSERHETQLDGTLFGEDQACFGCGPRHPSGFRLRFERDGNDVVTRFTPGDAHQGPPGIMHGGLLMTLADEAADWAIIALRGKFGFTATFSGKLIQPARIHVPLEARARIVKDARRLMDIAVEIGQQEARVFEASFRFAILDRGGAERLLERPLPDRWRRFCR